jgi:hypothetical protein
LCGRAGEQQESDNGDETWDREFLSKKPPARGVETGIFHDI